MPIGEFGGAPRLPGGGSPAFSTGLYWLYEMGQAALNPSRALADVTKLYFKNPLNPLSHTTFGKIDRRRRGDVRALHPPLRQAGLAHRLHARRRRARAGPYLDDLGAAVLQSAAFRARVRARAAPAAAEDPDRRADVGPLRDPAARNGGGIPAQSRRLRHRLGRCAHGAAVARDASISTITSTT